MNENIVFKVTRKYMKLNRRRTAVTFIGIVFMVILMTCVFAGKKTVMNYLQRVASIDKGSWHIIAYDLSAEEAQKLTDMDVMETVGRSEQLGCMEFAQTGNSEYKPFLNVKAYSSECFGMNNISLTEGRLPENEHEIIISDSAIQDGSAIKVGDTVSGGFFTRRINSLRTGDGATMFPFENLELKWGTSADVSNDFPASSENPDFSEEKVYNGLEGEFTVVGIMNAPGFEKTSGACYSALCGTSGQLTDKVNLFMILDLDKVGEMYDFRHETSDLLGRDIDFETNELVLAFAEKGDDSNIMGMTVFIEIFFTVLIMAASVVLIYNVFNMSFAERSKYLGMLSSVGATGRQKRQSIYFECVALLIPALPVGILAGLGVVAGGMQLIKPNLDKLIAMVKYGIATDIPVTLSIGLTEICLIVGMCIITVMISALIPAVKISRVGTIESIRGNTEKAKKAKKKRFATKKSLLEKGKPEMLIASNSTSRSKHLTKSIIRSICAFAVLAMVTLYGAKSVIDLVGIMSSASGWDYVPNDYSYYLMYDVEKNENVDSIKSMLDNKAITKKKEIIYTDLFIKMSSLSDDFNSSLKEIFLQYASNREESWERYLNDGGRTLMSNVLVVDDEEFLHLAENGDSDMSIAQNTSEPAALVYDNSTLSTDYYGFGENLKGYKCIEINETFNAQKGGEIVYQEYNSELESSVDITLRVAGRVNSESVKDRYKIVADAPYVFMNRSAFEMFSEKADLRSFSCTMFSSEDESVVKQISDFCEQSLNSDNEIMMGDFANRGTSKNIKQVIAAIVKILAYCFTGLVSVVCLLNLYNSIRGRAAERGRETAILRSMGMTDKQFRKMHDLESLMLLGKGLGIAAVICTVLCAGINVMLNSYFGRVNLPIPWLLSLGIAAFISAASFAITRLCYRKANAPEIIEEIRRETV